jgi:UDP-N-acetylmuramoylalanine--D-glutamate ligase
MRLNKLLDLDLPIGIVGMGASGRAALDLLLSCGVLRENIRTFDQSPHIESDFCDPNRYLQESGVKSLILSPGVPLKSPWIQYAIDSGIMLFSELDLGLSFLSSEKVVGVTGSIGKSTVVAALGHGLMVDYPSAFIGGNLGTPISSYASLKLRSDKHFEVAPWVLLELSSYQLEHTNFLSCHHSAITFLTPNHLERYNSLDDYYTTKWSLFEKTLGTRFGNKNGGDLISFSSRHPQTIEWLSRDDLFNRWRISNRSIGLLGEHNQDNLALALALADVMGASKEARSAIISFPGLPHRLENLGTYKSVQFINDSKATTVASVLQAVKSLFGSPEFRQRLVLLLGGRDKNLPWSELQSLNKFPEIQYFVFGEAAPKIRAALFEAQLWKATDLEYRSLKDCLADLQKNLKPGDLVLLSPGGVSQDEFNNFEDRGLFFKSSVEKYWGPLQQLKLTL